MKMCATIFVVTVCVLISPGIAHPLWILRPPPDYYGYSNGPQLGWSDERELYADSPTGGRREQIHSAPLSPQDRYFLQEAIKYGNRETIVEEMQRIWEQMTNEQKKLVVDRYRTIANSRNPTRNPTRNRNLPRKRKTFRMLIRELPDHERERIIQLRRNGMPGERVLQELKKTYERLNQGDFDDGIYDREYHGPEHPAVDIGRGSTRGDSDGNFGVNPVRTSGDLDVISTSGTSESTVEAEEERITSVETVIPETTTADPGSDLLGSLLKGKIGEVNWLGTLLGTDGEVDAEHGNALAQLFSGGVGGLLGPATK